MSSLNYLRFMSRVAVLPEAEKEKIQRSIGFIKLKLKKYFGNEIKAQFQFGSSTRGTILPRRLDERSDIDYMIVFSNGGYRPQTYLDRLRRFVADTYKASRVHQSHPTIVLNMNHIKFELVPAVEHFWSGYDIPAKATDYEDWIGTDPNDFNDDLTSRNQMYSNLTKPTIRLLKYWNAQNGYPFESFELEKQVVDMFFFWNSPRNVKEYVYSAFGELDLGLSSSVRSRYALERAQNHIREAKAYDGLGNDMLALKEIKKVIPPING
ncbi:hypothetical protein EDC59_107147 [Pseudodesulfovibrio indicus]|uniref:Nucleotidyltransferase n=2 Tax=Pseudodesulfovibrio indicus TaxID=1716143 RepID=A0A126QJV2_9BACT|nr:hypothetical protein AWY79_03450 [Pseudodesulfovibrio indicus]TDT87952.1 hypothetical protein EDC59_107147 [Pseudodesulfovibrio indicus]